MMSKTLSLSIVLLLTACSYKVMPSNKAGKEVVETAVSCSYAPLWLAPLNANYADVSMIAPANAKVVSVTQKVYPFVLFTKSCVHVEYTK